MRQYKTIKSYIVAQEKEKRVILQEIYDIVRTEARGVTEAIKYGMPTFVGKGNLVHFAAMRGHLGFYPTPSAIAYFAKELAGYSTSKGCVRFPYDKPIPKSLITKMVRFRVKEDAKTL